MTPTPEAWAVAARILPGGRWHKYATRILRRGCPDEQEIEELLSEARIRIANAWHRYDPARGRAEWTFAKWFILAEHSKRKRSKGGIVGPQHNNIKKLWPDSKAAWTNLSTVSLEAPIRSKAGSVRTVADVVAAAPDRDEARLAAVVQETIARVAERAVDRRDRRRLLTLAETLRAGEGGDRTVGDRLGVSRQRVSMLRLEGTAYLAEALTPAERMTLSMTRSPDV